MLRISTCFFTIINVDFGEAQMLCVALCPPCLPTTPHEVNKALALYTCEHAIMEMGCLQSE